MTVRVTLREAAEEDLRHHALIIIFYIADDIAVRVLRILHGAQDLEAVFEE